MGLIFVVPTERERSAWDLLFTIPAANPNGCAVPTFVIPPVPACRGTEANRSGGTCCLPGGRGNAPHLQRNLERVHNVIRRNPGALLRRAPRRRIQLHVQEPSPLNAVEVGLQTRKINPAGAHRKEIGSL